MDIQCSTFRHLDREAMINTEINHTTVPWVLAFTPNYFIPAATCIQSALEHSSSEDRFHIICLLTEQLPDRMVEMLKGLDKLDRIRYTFIEMKDRLNGVYVDERYTIAASFRLLLPVLLPEYDKVIYSDCDMIIRNSLGQIYRETELGDNYLGVVHEASLPFQEENIRRLGCTPGFYFNSGFLVMNLKKMREDNMSEVLIDALKTDYLEFPDQDVLNIHCQGKVVPLSPWYNSIRTFFLPQYKKDFLKKYSEEDWKKVWAHGTIHYTGEKPWNTYTVQFDVWWKYYFSLPEEIRGEFPVNKKMVRLYRFYSTKVGKWMFDTAQKVYRSLK